MEPVALLVRAPREDGPPVPDGLSLYRPLPPRPGAGQVKGSFCFFAFLVSGPFNSLQPSLLTGRTSGTRPRAMPPIPDCIRPGAFCLSPVFDFEIVEKNGAGCKLVLSGRALTGTGPKPYKPASRLIIAATISLNRVSRTDFQARATCSYKTIGVAPPQGVIALASPMR